MVFWSRKRPLLKNPCNTGRVSELLDMYPDAKIIHIHRHPDAVYRSNMRLASDGHATFQLQDQLPDERSYQQRFLANYRAMEQAYYSAAATTSGQVCAEVRFEDLEADPVREITRVYRQLGLECSPEFLRRLSGYLESLQDYAKNSYQGLDQETTRRIDRQMGGFMQQWGYARDVKRAA